MNQLVPPPGPDPAGPSIRCARWHIRGSRCHVTAAKIRRTCFCLTPNSLINTLP
nr:MAG TPA: hypothetical protein [Caudoviricetes sp.]